MTLNELRYIVAVARERHFGRAAEASYVSQPTLSVAVKKLEDELGVGLFERGQGEVSLTPAGGPIITQAQRVLEEADVLRQLASQSRDQLVGPLRIGAIYTIGPYLFPYLIPRFTRFTRQMPLVIRENFTAVLGEQLKRGELDAIVISLPFEEPGIQTRDLYDESFSVLLPAGHHLAAETAISPLLLRGENVLLLGEGHCFRDQVLQACPECLQRGRNQENLQRNLEGCSLETIRCMVASGVGVTILPDTAVDHHTLPGELLVSRPLAGSAPNRRVALAWRRSFPRPQAVELLWKTIRECSIDGVQLI
jgi:LysR family hydrogen peroxide-inducible transcriptional activator